MFSCRDGNLFLHAVCGIERVYRPGDIMALTKGYGLRCVSFNVSCDNGSISDAGGWNCIDAIARGTCAACLQKS